jgi:hypothetical protein
MRWHGWFSVGESSVSLFKCQCSYPGYEVREKPGSTSSYNSWTGEYPRYWDWVACRNRIGITGRNCPISRWCPCSRQYLRGSQGEFLYHGKVLIGDKAGCCHAVGKTMLAGDVHHERCAQAELGGIRRASCCGAKAALVRRL